MKKVLFVMAVAAVALASCSNESTEYVGDSNSSPKEIVLNPLAQPPTRAAVQGTEFPTTNKMEVVAYQSAPGDGANYFTQTTFERTQVSDAPSYAWTGSKYWPLMDGVTLNFFAISAKDVTNSHIVIPAELPSTTTGATVAYTAGNSYNTTNSDIMYSFARGTVTKSTNTLSFPQVNMVFKHTQSQVRFQIKAGNAASAGITINSITVNDASVTGNLTIKPTTSTDDANITANTGAVDFTAAWTDYPDAASWAVPGVDTKIGALVNGTFKPADDAANADRTALLIIPERGFSGFTINYSFGGKNYSYTYADSNAPSTQGTVYSYKITMTLHEIQVVPTVTNWDTTIDEETPSVG